MLCRFTLLIGLVATALTTALPASAERRVALVIGNSSYVSAAALRNPRHDASDMAETLKILGFEVELGLDLDQQHFARTIERFARALDSADVGLFFYAGHGLQLNDKNYLVSVNAKLDSEFLLSSETIELEAIVRLMESKVPVNLVFLDACRNNPLAENLRQNLSALRRSVTLGRGLARIEPTSRDTLIAYAAAPGQEAIDGSSRNSPFTSSLLRNMTRPGVEVSVMLKEVAADVRRETRNAQRPQQLSDMSRTFYFAKAEPAAQTATAPPAAAPQSPPAAPPPSSPGDDRALEVAYWTAASGANDCEAVRAYLRRFPKGVFVDLGRLAERRLCVSNRDVTVLDTAAPSLAATAPAQPGPPSAAPEPPAAAPPPQVAAVPDPALQAATPPAAPGPDLARSIQLELHRLGCASGNADGKWGAGTRSAISRFNRYAKATLDTDAPSPATIAALREHNERVCPLECGRGYRALEDSCIAVERPQRPDRNAKRPAEQPRPKTSAAPAPARASAAPAKSGPTSPLCESRIQVGGKWCCTHDPPRGPSIIICN